VLGPVRLALDIVSARRADRPATLTPGRSPSRPAEPRAAKAAAQRVVDDDIITFADESLNPLQPKRHKTSACLIGSMTIRMTTSVDSTGSTTVQMGSHKRVRTTVTRSDWP